MKKILIVAAVPLVIAGAVFAWYEEQRLVIAHSTFENYYAFRGCTQLVEKTSTYGTCKLASGQVIKLVLMKGKWYLEGDGPGVL